MQTGIIILNVFAAIWVVLGLVFMQAPSWMLVGPVLLSLGLVGWSWKKREMASNQGEAESRRIGRLVGLWSGAEGLAILLAAIILGNLGKFSLFTPVLSVIVGAHFFPLARGIPMRLYYLTGGLLMVLGTGAMPTPYPFSWVITGIGAALVLWLTVLVLRACAGGKFNRERV